MRTSMLIAAALLTAALFGTRPAAAEPANGDVIVAVQGIAFGGPDAYEKIRLRLSAIPPGGSIRLAVLRRGEIVELSGAAPR